MQVLRIIGSVLLAVVVLISTSGFAVYRHDCSSQGTQTISIIPGADCGRHDAPSSCCDVRTTPKCCDSVAMPKDCCQDYATVFKIDEPQSLASGHVVVPKHWATAVIVCQARAFPTVAPIPGVMPTVSPPFPFTDRVVWLQTFLI